MRKLSKTFKEEITDKSKQKFIATPICMYCLNNNSEYAEESEQGYISFVCSKCKKERGL